MSLVLELDLGLVKAETLVAIIDKAVHHPPEVGQLHPNNDIRLSQ